MFRPAAWLILSLAIVLASACDKVPLLAPTQSTITLSINTTTLPINGTAEVIATVTEQPGTPVQNGTQVTFSASFGTMDPVTADTVGGQARSTFRAGTQSGTAKINATSGAARTTAAAGELSVLVGAAGADSVTVRTEPTFVPQTGGTVQVIAIVVDVSGNPIALAPVSFSSDNGSLGSAQVTTDLAGEARTTLTTSRQSVVTARVAAKSGTATVTIVTAPTVSVSVTSTGATLNVGQSVAFTVTPGTPGTTSNPIGQVTVDFGDGTTQQALGPITGPTSVTHIYRTEGNYTVTAFITDTNGIRGQGSASVSIGRATPTISITGPSGTQNVNQSLSFTVTPGPPTPGISTQQITVDFGDGTPPQSLGPVTGPTPVTHTYTREGNYTVTAFITDSQGTRGQGSFSVSIGRALPTATISGPTQPVNVGEQVNFTINSSPGTNGPPIDHVDVVFSDGVTRTVPGGSQPVSRTFNTPGTIEVSATPVDTAGTRGTASRTTVTVRPRAPLEVQVDAFSADGQFTVNCTPQNTYPKTCTVTSGLFTPVGASPRVQFQASFAPGGGPAAGDAVVSYDWDFGDGTPPVRTTTRGTDHTFQRGGFGGARTYVVTVRVTTINGSTGTGQITLQVE